MSHVTHITTNPRVMSHLWMNHSTHVTLVNESWHTCTTTTLTIASNISVMSHMWMRHVTHINESCHTYEWVMSDKWIMSHMHHHCITNCQQYLHEFVQPFAECMHKRDMTYMSHLWMNHVTCKRQWIMSHMYMYCHTITNCQQHLHKFVQPFAGRMHKRDMTYMSHLWMNHVTCKCQWIMSRMYMYYHTITNCQHLQ